MDPATDTIAKTDPASVLGPGGSLAQLIPGYEARTQQLAMADTIAQAIAERTHAIVEAPTGVGKSFAYLVPLAQYALATRKKVVVSTGTIALQEQLVHKDIPLLQKVFPQLKAVLVKGRQNYLSRRRLEHAGGQRAWMEDQHQVADLASVRTWAAESAVGDLEDLGYEPDPAVWRKVQSDRNNCLGRKCDTYNTCFFYNARRRIEDADLLIVNHHLYFADLALRDATAAILPAHPVVVFDEAHTVEDVATDHLGMSLSEAQIRYYLDGLWSTKGKVRGLLQSDHYASARGAVDAARAACQAFWSDVALATGDGRSETVRIAEPGRFTDPLAPALDGVAEAIMTLAGHAEDSNEQQELQAQALRAVEFAGSLRSLVGHGIADYIYYASVPRERGSPSLTASPLHVGPHLKEKLFAAMPTVVLTSATLAADASDRFLFLRKRLGIEGGAALRLDSPFDYRQQAKLLVNESSLDPNGPRFEQALAQWLGDYLETARGGTFVLFTSYRQLQAVHDLVRPRLDRANRFVLRHGERMGRKQMLDLFKATGDAVLFGTSTFWEGVDVPGDALRHVVIAKIPFEVPDHPLTEARLADITRRGGNAFMERSVPEAILRLKQGVGRLIRTRNDTGTVVIADHRVLTKQYGRYFLKALPPMPLERFRLE